MIMQTFQVSEVRKKNSDMVLDDVAGISVLDEFETWAGSLDKSHFKNSTKKHYGTKPKMRRRNRIVVAQMRTGHYGTVGDQVIDTSTHTKAYGTKADDAQTVETRCAFLIPPGSRVGLFFTEKQAFESCGGMLLGSFSAHLKDSAEKIKRPDGKTYKLKISIETVVEPDAWVATAHMQSVTAIKYEYTKDVGDEHATKSVNMQYATTLQPVKGNPFLPDMVRDMVFDKKLEAAAHLGFPDDLNYDELIVKLGDGDQSKTMVIDKQKTPAIRVLLNDHGQSHLKLTELIATIDEEAKTFYERRKLSWDYSWTRKPPASTAAV